MNKNICKLLYIALIIQYSLFTGVSFAEGKLPETEQTKEYLLDLKPLISERMESLAHDSKEWRATLGTWSLSSFAGSLACGLADNNIKARNEYISLASMSFLSWTLTYFSPLPNRIEYAYSEIEKIPLGTYREAFSYGKMEEIAKEERFTRYWIAPVALLVGTAAALSAKDDISSTKYVYFGIGTFIGVWGIYQAIVPSNIEKEYAKVNVELEQESKKERK